jgi:Ca2+-binding EF-hand superfamily protein
MAEIWRRKIRTFFHRLDVDDDGVISKREIDLFAERLIAAKKADPVLQEKIRKRTDDIWHKFTGSTKTDEKGFLTEAMLIASLKKQLSDPKLKVTLQESCRNFFDLANIVEDGYLQFQEYRKAFDNMGLSDTSFAEQSFNVIDTDQDGKLTRDEFTHACMECLLSEDEDSPYNLFWGPLLYM